MFVCTNLWLRVVYFFVGPYVLGFNVRLILVVVHSCMYVIYFIECMLV
jgi:hypothetical protein